MAKVFIHPNPNQGGANAAYFAIEVSNLGKQAAAYNSQLQKVFTFITNNSVRAGEGGAPSDDYTDAAAAIGITTAQCSTLWNLLNGAQTAWNGGGTNANNKTLSETVG